MAVHAVDSETSSRGPGACRVRALDDASLHPVRRTRPAVITATTIGIVVLSSIALFAFGANLLYLTWRAPRLRPVRYEPMAEGREPRVCVQVPIYNERYVAERVLDAVCGMDWPLRFEVQVLDDSDDDTVSIVASRVAHWRRRGVSVSQVRRGSRDGFKAGALAHGLQLTDSPFIAIFDADFIPQRISCAAPWVPLRIRQSASHRRDGGTSTRATRGSPACRHTRLIFTS